MDKGENVIYVGRRVRLVMRNLVNCDDLPIVGEHHCLKDGRGNCFHSVHVATTEQDIVIEWGVNNFNVDKDSLTPSYTRTFWKSPSGYDGSPS
jgi:hypothetical protein